MSTSLYSEIESDLRIKGDYVLVDGTMEVTGASTLTGKVTASAGLALTGTLTAATIAGLTAPTIAGGLTLSAPAATTTQTLTISSKMTTHTGVTVGAPSGTLAGVVWTSGAPELTAGQLFIVLTCGSTAYRVPVWANA